MNRRWLVSRTNPDFIQYLSRAASISPILAQVLVNRGIKTTEEIADFLNPGVTALSDPFELPGMAAAVERIKSAAERGEHVLVHGDYDTDGLTATAIVVQALRAMGVSVSYFIPNRMTHGYGFNAPSVEEAHRRGARLIITVDCGISSFDAAALARNLGIDVIITDHHEPVRSAGDGDAPGMPARPVLPEAVAVVNPKLAERSRMSDLSGAGVAFKVVHALALDSRTTLSVDDAVGLLDLAALGTVADVVPLLGENRAIIREGLRQIVAASRPGLRSLAAVSGIRERELRASLLSFTMVPRINAAGRIDDAEDVVLLFLSASGDESDGIAERLSKINTDRQRIEEEIYQEARAEAQRIGVDGVIVLAGEGWHIGVIGIVASRIAEEFGRPAFVFSLREGIAKGSARSIPGFDVHQALGSCSDLLIRFGGHKQAAGMKLSAGNLRAFTERMNALALDFLARKEAVPALEIDGEVVLSLINNSLVREFSLLEPIGCGNPEPLLGARGVDVINPRIVGRNHLKMRLKQRSSALEAIGFDMGSLFESLAATSLDVVFTPTMNEWNGSRHLQLNLRAFRASQ